MTIAVHIAMPATEKDLSSNFLYNCFSILATKNPQDHFIFIFDKPHNFRQITETNITPVLLGPQVKNRLLQHYFYNFKVPRLLLKYEANLFVSCEVCSLRTTVPQYLVIRDLSFLQKQHFLEKNESWYLNRFTKKFLHKASGTGVLNASLKKIISEKYIIPDEKISLLNQGITGFPSYNYEQAEETRQRHTEGKAYFLFFATAASAGNTITVLKAFSIFKKWQKSNMQLVILFSPKKKYEIKDFENYKYRSDVKLFYSEDKKVCADLIAAAYAVLNFPTPGISETQGLEALSAPVAMINTEGEFFKAIYHDAVLYTAIHEKDIAEKMMLLYKDEAGRNDLLTKAAALSARYTWHNAASVLWQTIPAVGNR